MNTINALLEKFENNFTPEKMFLFFGLFFGFIWIFLVPPCQIPDEPNHFKRVYQISEGGFLPEKKDGLTREEIEPNVFDKINDTSNTMLGGYLPKNLHEASDFRNNFHVSNRGKLKRDYYKDYLGKPLNKEERLFYSFPNAAMYSPVSYFPQSLGIFIANSIGNFSALTIFFAGRLGGFLFWFLITYYAIKIIPVFKWMLFLIAFFPMTLFQAISNSADSVIIACSFLFIALILDAMKNNATNKRLALIFIMSIFLSLGKYIYYGLVPLFLLVILYNTENRKKLIMFFVSMLVVNFILVTFLVKTLQPFYVPPMPYINPPVQLQYVIANPILFVQMFFVRFFTDLPALLINTIGMLGWLDLPLPSKIYFFYLFAMILTPFLDGDNFKISIPSKGFLFLIVAGFVFASYFIQYLVWNAPQNDTIEGGQQGRYYIPILPLFFLLFYRENTSLNKYLKLILCIGIFISLFTCCNVFLKEYYLK